MYSRSLDPRRIPSTLPSHYSGSAFRADGTPTPIPVRREHDGGARRSIPEEDGEVQPRQDVRIPDPVGIRGDDAASPFRSLPFGAEEAAVKDAVAEEMPMPAGRDHAERALEYERPERPAIHSDDAPFLTRLFGGLLPGIRDDDILLILLLLLLSREKGTEDVLLLLAFLLLGK